MSTLSIALTFFLVANPIGNSPAIISLVRHLPFERQKRIVFREAMISLAIALFFQYFGEIFLSLLHVSQYALSLTGGLVIFLVALQMIFHKPETTLDQIKQEPFIVPIALPLISGPGLMTFIMINSAQEANDIKITTAILFAWIGVTLVLVVAPYLQKVLGQRGMAALEHVMGLVLALISTELIIDGLKLFIQTLNPVLN